MLVVRVTLSGSDGTDCYSPPTQSAIGSNSLLVRCQLLRSIVRLCELLAPNVQFRWLGVAIGAREFELPRDVARANSSDK